MKSNQTTNINMKFQKFQNIMVSVGGYIPRIALRIVGDSQKYE